MLAFKSNVPRELLAATAGVPPRNRPGAKQSGRSPADWRPIPPPASGIRRPRSGVENLSITESQRNLHKRSLGGNGRKWESWAKVRRRVGRGDSRLSLVRGHVPLIMTFPVDPHAVLEAA